MRSLASVHRFKALPQLSGSLSGEHIWHVKAVHPEGRLLDVKAIDNALPRANLSAKQKEEVKLLRDEGEAQHKAGDHAGSVKTLAEAMRIILNNL